MTIRTSATAVKGVLNRDYDTRNSPSLTPYIETASVITDQIEECVLAKGITYTFSRLELIERWLSAHFYAVSDRPYADKTTDGAKAKFDGMTEMGFDFTGYGQMAKRIDYLGCLADLDKIDKKVAASITWLGKPPSAQLPYHERD